MSCSRVSNRSESISVSGRTVGQIKSEISSKIGKPKDSILLVDRKDLTVFENDGQVIDCMEPNIQFIVANDDRRVESSDELKTKETDVFGIDEASVKMECECATTPDSIAGFLYSKLVKDKESELLCWGCKKELKFSKCAKLADLSRDERVFYQEKQNLNFMLRNDMKVCPTCRNFCTRQAGVFAAVRCYHCTKISKNPVDFCWICNAPWQTSHKCDNKCKKQVQEILNNAKKVKLQMSHIENVPSIRLCPKCSALIEYLELCKQMECKECHAQFCFSCLKICEAGKLVCSPYNEKCPVADVQKVT